MDEYYDDEEYGGEDDTVVFGDNDHSYPEHRPGMKRRFPPWRKKNLSGAERRKRKKESLRAQGYTNVNAIIEGRIPKSAAIRLVPGSPKFETNSVTGKQENISTGNENSAYFPKTRPRLIKVAIVPENYPDIRIDTTQLELLREFLGAIIDNLPTDGHIPKLQTILSNGLVLALCKDDESVTWLKSCITEYNSSDGVNLKILEENEIPIIIKLHIPGQKLDVPTILARIEKQNEGVDTKMWKVLNYSEDETTVILEICIDKESHKTVVQTGYKLYCGAVKTFRASFLNK